MRSSPRPISALREQYPGESLLVIGSGPSLALLSPDMLGDGPVVAINYAIRKVETLALSNPVFSVQKDQAYALCKAPILAHSRESARNGGFGDYIFDCEVDFGIPWNTPSIVVTLYLARLFGCRNAKFFACDSFYGDLRSYDAQNPASLDRRASQYAKHPSMVSQAAQSLGMSWSVA